MSGDAIRTFNTISGAFVKLRDILWTELLPEDQVAFLEVQTLLQTWLANVPDDTSPLPTPAQTASGENL